MEVHETTAIGKANKCNIEDDEALAEVRKYPCLYPMFSFFCYVNEILETSETKKERVLQLRNRRPNHYPFYQF